MTQREIILKKIEDLLWEREEVLYQLYNGHYELDIVADLIYDEIQELRYELDCLN